MLSSYLLGVNVVLDLPAGTADALDFVLWRLRAALRLRSQTNWQSLLVLSSYLLGVNVVLDLRAGRADALDFVLWRLRPAVSTALLALVGCSVEVWSTGLK